MFKVQASSFILERLKEINVSLSSPKYYNIPLLGAFAKLLQASISCDVTVRPRGTTRFQLYEFS